MKSLLLALCAFALCVSAVSAATKIADRPQTKAFVYLTAYINTGDHRAYFNGAVANTCSTPEHKGIDPSFHWHDWQTLHSNSCSTSGNWWNADRTIWQLKRSWCNCEGFSSINCTYAQGNVRAWCYI